MKNAIKHLLAAVMERQALVDEMTDIIDDMVEFKWYRVEQNVVRFADSRFGRKHDGNYRYNEPDSDGQMKIKGGAFDEPRSQCRTEERGNGRDPTQGYHNVGFRILREKNWAASVIQNANAASWLSRNVEGGSSLTAADYKALEEDSDSDGIPTWAEYIALTDPNDAESRFNATISIGADGVPVVGWNTQTSPSRTYTVFGKVDLSDSVWLEVNENAGLYRFFKVAVDLK